VREPRVTTGRREKVVVMAPTTRSDEPREFVDAHLRGARLVRADLSGADGPHPAR
jgi:hypothetical protein